MSLRFLLSPRRFEPREDDPESLGSVVFERTKLQGEANKQKAVLTGEFEMMSASLALVSVGYRGLALEGTEGWFAEREGRYRHNAGKVQDQVGGLGGVYVSGWVKRGPNGIIGSNISDARETVKSVVHDLQCVAPKSTTDGADVSLSELFQEREVKWVDWNGYRMLEKKEHGIRRHEAQPREKITSISEMLSASGVTNEATSKLE